MTREFGMDLALSSNCILVAGKRAGEERIAACVVRATTNADINHVVKKRLDVRKASFWPQDRAVEASGMEYGGITPVGVPSSWRLLIDSACASGWSCIGSGLRRSKLFVTGEVLAALRERRSSRASGSKHVGSRPEVHSALPPPFHARFTGNEAGARQGKNRTIDARQGTPKAWQQCPRSAAGPGHSQRHAPPDWRPPRGLRGLASAHSTTSAAGVTGARGPGGHGRASRSTTPSRRLACGDLAGGRARRRPEHLRHHKQQKTPEPHWVPGLAAEDGGFEPPRACTQHAFQACAIGH